MADQNPLTRPTSLPDRSDYFHWNADDVEWEKPPQDPPPMPTLPESPAPLPDRFPRQSGADIFDALSSAEQDERFGREVAAALRDGTLKLSDLIVRQTMETERDFISQASPADLGLDSSKEEGT